VADLRLIPICCTDAVVLIVRITRPSRFVLGGNLDPEREKGIREVRAGWARLLLKHTQSDISIDVILGGLPFEQEALRGFSRPHAAPADGSSHWSTRKLGAHLEVSHMMVARVWRKHGLKPHRIERYMASNDPDFEKKAADIIGLYLNPPAHAAVFCVDEKTAIQALDRKDPVLPLSPGRAERHGFEYFRHGTLSLHAAFNTKTGEVLGKTAAQHTSAEFVAFLTDIVINQPRGKDLPRNRSRATCCSCSYRRRQSCIPCLDSRIRGARLKVGRSMRRRSHKSWASITMILSARSVMRKPGLVSRPGTRGWIVPAVAPRTGVPTNNNSV
jgi:hypothetical protein